MDGIYLAPVPPEPLRSAASGRFYGAALCSVGYESRSSAIASALRSSTSALIGVEFHHGHTDIYEKNRTLFDRLEAEVMRLDDDQFCEWVAGWLPSLAASGCETVAVDVSSMSRPRIAGVIQAITALPRNVTLTVDLLYTSAQYRPAPKEMPDATEALDPVTDAFAGTPVDPAEPLVLIFGLGYEPERAASAVDEFAPQLSLPFFPIGRDDRFRHDVAEANEGVLALPDVREPIQYAINDPFRTFCDLEVTVEAVQRGSDASSRDGTVRPPARPLLLPLGPKIFAATCMLLAASSRSPIPVWRVSSGVFERPEDRCSDGELVTLRVGRAPIPPALAGGVSEGEV